jgi:AcrR family transcriptional regulator
MAGEAKAPRRARGHARVATLLAAASAEFAEKGYEATTMTAIAARAQSSIGSLYQFFPTKEQVAGTLLEQYVGQIVEALDRLGEEASRLGVSTVAQRLATLFVAFRTTHPAFEILADAMALTLPGAIGVRERLRKSIASVVAPFAPGLSEDQVLLHAAVVQHLMKAAVTLSRDATIAQPDAAMSELQRVIERYLADLACGESRGRAHRRTGA